MNIFHYRVFLKKNDLHGSREGYVLATNITDAISKINSTLEKNNYIENIGQLNGVYHEVIE